MNRFFVDFDGRVFDKSIDITGEDVNHIKNMNWNRLLLRISVRSLWSSVLIFHS